MALEVFGWILVALGVVTFVYGYLKASARLDVEERMKPSGPFVGVDVLPRVDVRPEDAPPSGGLPPPVRVYGGVHDWERDGEL